MKCSLAAEAANVTRRVALLKEIVAIHAPTLLALQEAPDDAILRAALGAVYDLVSSVAGVCSAFDTRRWACDEKDSSEPKVVTVGLSALGAGTSLWLVNVHAPALWVDQTDKLKFMSQTVRQKLVTLRQKPGDRAEIVAGDFNMPPFAQGIVRDIGLHANRHLPWVERRQTGVERALFNPTWKLFANHDGASGTYYSSKLGDDGPWHAIDQILVTHDLSTDFRLATIDAVGLTGLRKAAGKGAPDAETGSDHLPLLAHLNVP